ncbi:unnamed protein product [Hermetia illucens]|uniref:Uncharacterized protein n=1 Tax=Hermetia illucens TaxID=343691 RepID=A0A7R8V5Y6_HERIL|nr:unnamed protein product [Hermetia illucens]
MCQSYRHAEEHQSRLQGIRSFSIQSAQFSSENQCDNEDEDQKTQRRIVVLSSCDVAANEEVSTSKASTSEIASTSGISFASLYEALKAVGPVKQGTPAKKSNRSRKPMQTTILTSPEVVSNLQQKADNRHKKTETHKQKDDARTNPVKQQKIVLQLHQRRISKSNQRLMKTWIPASFAAKN